VSREIYCACVVAGMCVSREMGHFIPHPKRTVQCLLWEQSHFLKIIKNYINMYKILIILIFKI